MKEKLTSREIATRYKITQRTAFRWLAANDERCYGEVHYGAENKPIENANELELRAILDRLANQNLNLAIWQWQAQERNEARAEMIGKHRHKLYEAINAMQRESGVYPASHWEDEGE
jgi:hypothetical protein